MLQSLSAAGWSDLIGGMQGCSAAVTTSRACSRRGCAAGATARPALDWGWSQRGNLKDMSSVSLKSVPSLVRDGAWLDIGAVAGAVGVPCIWSGGPGTGPAYQSMFCRCFPPDTERVQTTDSNTKDHLWHLISSIQKRYRCQYFKTKICE